MKLLRWHRYGVFYRHGTSRYEVLRTRSLMTAIRLTAKLCQMQVIEGTIPTTYFYEELP